jgi:dTDP-4-amino-4,6-dideoxygalactose transaminase
MERQYENEIVGYNLRMTDLAAAMGRVQLRRLAGFNEQRRETAAVYDLAFGDLAGIGAPPVAVGARHVYHQYTVRTPERDRLQAHLVERGIDSRVYYPTPVHRLLPYRDAVDLPETDRAASEVLSLPVGPHLSGKDVDHVVEGVLSWAS